MCWGDLKQPPVIKTNTGRKRLNILGAYNPDSHRFVHLTGEENCDAKRVIAYFEVILMAYHKAPTYRPDLGQCPVFQGGNGQEMA